MTCATRRPGFLREAELRLLRCTLPALPSAPPPPASPPPAHPLGPAAASALAAVEAGDYEAALAAAAPHLLQASASSGPPGSAAQFYAELGAAARAFMLGDGDGGAAGEGFECRCVVVLSAAVAALLAFTQQNVTGPPRKFPTFPFWISSLDERCYSNLGDIWDAWASDNLASFGSHVHGKFSLLQGSGLWHDQMKFAKYAQASLKLCKVYMEISSSTGSRRELFTAEMHLKSTLKQAMDFSDTEEYKALDNCLEEIKNLIAATA